MANSLSNFDTKSMMWVKMATGEGILFCVAGDILPQLKGKLKK